MFEKVKAFVVKWKTPIIIVTALAAIFAGVKIFLGGKGKKGSTAKRV